MSAFHSESFHLHNADIYGSATGLLPVSSTFCLHRRPLWYLPQLSSPNFTPTLNFSSLVLWYYEILISSRSLTLISASSTHSRCRPQEIVSYSWVGNNSRVINYLSLVRPFLFPSSLKWQCSSNRQPSRHSTSLMSTQIQSNQLSFPSLDTKPKHPSLCVTSFIVCQLAQLHFNAQLPSETTSEFNPNSQSPSIQVTESSNTTQSMPDLPISPQSTCPKITPPFKFSTHTD